jgi:hypothetical protein
MEPAVAEQNWNRIEAAPKGAGPLLLREGSGSQDPAFVGYQGDDGQWRSGDSVCRPRYFCRIPPFDCELPDDGVAA